MDAFFFPYNGKEIILWSYYMQYWIGAYHCQLIMKPISLTLNICGLYHCHMNSFCTQFEAVACDFFQPETEWLNETVFLMSDFFLLSCISWPNWQVGLYLVKNESISYIFPSIFENS